MMIKHKLMLISDKDPLLALCLDVLATQCKTSTHLKTLPWQKSAHLRGPSTVSSEWSYLLPLQGLLEGAAGAQ